MPTTYAIPNGSTAFAATTYTGNGSTQSVSNAVNGTSFQPDFVWFKSRATTYYHALFDSVRGVTKGLASNDTTFEFTSTAGTDLAAFTSTGFTVGAPEQWNSPNNSSSNPVAWQWKAGGAAVTNTAGSITSQVSANTAAGFSVVTYSANGSTGTVGHGLGVAPSMIIVKKRNAVERWCVYHVSTSNAYLYLNETNAAETGNAQLRFGNNSSVVQPASTLFTIGSSNDVNGSSGTYVAYCFAAVPGYSAFGSYTGNGSTDGPFCYTGFRPRFFMTKCSSGTGDWHMTDTSRYPTNSSTSMGYLDANTNGVEGNYNIYDGLSNGFKVRDNGSQVNGSGATYIYMAFAENPFKYANAR